VRDYSKVVPTFWTGDTGKALRKRGPDAMMAAVYLLTSPNSNMLGLFYQPLLYMAHETGLGVERASEGVKACIDVGFCQYDTLTEMVWVVEMASFQIDKQLKASDNRCVGIQREYDGLPDNPFLGAFFDRYREAFHMGTRRDSKAPSHPLPSQEQEQEQEQEQDLQSSLRSDSSTAAPMTDLLTGTGSQKKVNGSLTEKIERLHVVAGEAIAAYNRILAKPAGLLAAVHPTVGRQKRVDQVKRCRITAAEICKDQFGDSKITPEFWDQYFTACSEDGFTSGAGPYTGAHANWRPDFEFLTRPAQMLKVFEKATDAEGES
jgi:hypothetical protein